jgi:CRP/FNR family transcriptional regulator, cyclic AMP receptor protein
MDSASVKDVPLFASVPKREHGNVARWADEVYVPAGTTVMKQGEYAREFAVIVEGSAAVVRDGEHLTTLGPGEFFGEVGMLEGPSRSASVVAVTDLRLLVVGPREFTSLMHTAPGVAAEIKRVAAERSPNQG